MTKPKTILFETVTAATQAFATLQPMIDVSLDGNALTYHPDDEEAVRWLVENPYCQLYEKVRCFPRRGRILLVDDDPNLTLILSDYLEEFKGLQCFTDLSGEAGWESYRMNSPDIIISGISMEDLDAGYRFFHRVKEDCCHQPFIFLSSQLTIPHRREQAYRLEADAYFCKPFELEEVFAEIEKIFAMAETT